MFIFSFFEISYKAIRKIFRLLNDFISKSRDGRSTTYIADREFLEILKENSVASLDESKSVWKIDGLAELFTETRRSRAKEILYAHQGSIHAFPMKDVENIFAHHLKLLDSTTVDVNVDPFIDLKDDNSFPHVVHLGNVEKIKNTIEEVAYFVDDHHEQTKRLIQKTTKCGNYNPIDWHKDFNTGYSWDPDCWYKDIDITPRRGVDIKIPWELSRCQHLPALGIYSLGSDVSEDFHDEIALQIVDWIVSNEPRRGVNWRTSMEVGIRAINLIWAWSILPADCRSPSVEWILKKSLYQHALHIESNLDYSPTHTNNHYLADLVGLFYISVVCTDFPQRYRWMAFCLQEVVSEMRRTVYSDGVNWESSASYHCLVTELFLHGFYLSTLLTTGDKRKISECDERLHKKKPRLKEKGLWEFNINAVEVFPVWFTNRLASMVGYIEVVTKPNGLVPQWGDIDNGRVLMLPKVPKDSDIEFIYKSHPSDYSSISLMGEIILFGAERLQSLTEDSFEQTIFAGKNPISNEFLVSSKEFNELREINSSGQYSSYLYPVGGTCVLKNDIIWIGTTFSKVGQNGIGSHAHNDILSIELNVNGIDFIVDWGTGVYTRDYKLRNCLRSTRSHSTVVLDNTEQNHIQDGLKNIFRMREKAFPKALDFYHDMFVGSHKGYGVTHKRRIKISDSGVLIEDTLSTQKKSSILLTLHPMVDVEIDNEDNIIRLSRSGVELTVIPDASNRAIRLETGTYSEGYGVLLESKKVIIDRSNSSDSIFIKVNKP